MPRSFGDSTYFIHGPGNVGRHRIELADTHLARRRTQEAHFDEINANNKLSREHHNLPPLSRNLFAGTGGSTGRRDIPYLA